MICYGIGILPLIRMLQSEFPAAKQQGFAYDGSTPGKLVDIMRGLSDFSSLVPTTEISRIGEVHL